jgi:hypothetical protein
MSPPAASSVWMGSGRRRTVRSILRLWHPEPQAAGEHHCGDVGALHAGAERIEGAVRRAVGVGADYEVTRCEMTAFREHLMADAVPHVV